MIAEKTTMSARVSVILKKIVEDSEYSQRDAYELGAKLIAIGKAEELTGLINNDPNFQKIIKKTEYRIVEAKKIELEKELENL